MPGGDGVLVECLSCNQRDRAESLGAVQPGGDWHCPQCHHGVAVGVTEDDEAP